MTTKGKILLWILVMGFFDAVIPGLPIIALVLIYVVLVRPSWFADLVHEIYRQ